MMLRRVVLPEPLPPMTEMKSPSRIVRLIPLRAFRSFAGLLSMWKVFSKALHSSMRNLLRGTMAPFDFEFSNERRQGDHQDKKQGFVEVEHIIPIAHDFEEDLNDVPIEERPGDRDKKRGFEALVRDHFAKEDDR